MKNENRIISFQNKKIRRQWDGKTEKWYFSIIDVIEVLTDTTIPRRYWSDLKSKLKNEGSEVYEKIVQLKILASDGKQRRTDCFSTEDLLRVIQSIPSPKAEPFKLWLAKVGYERMQEITDPEKALNRSREYWQKLGRSRKWIQQRMMGQEIRNKLTDYWKDNEVRERDEYAILTNIIHQEWSDLSVKEHKDLKNLKTENLRDHMTDAELIFTALANYQPDKLLKVKKPEGLKRIKFRPKKAEELLKMPEWS